MRVIAVIDADLENTPLGTRSRQAEPLCGTPVLQRTVARVLAAQEPVEVHVICPPDQLDRCQSMLQGADVIVRSTDAGPAPYQKLNQVARKWSLDGWRGGMGGACCFDEYGHIGVWAALAQETSADAIWTCPGAAPLVDPTIIDAMIRHYVDSAHNMRMTFAPAPPGLVGTIFHSALLSELAAQNIPPGWTLAYKPDAPQIDLAFKDCCWPAPEEIRHAEGRLITDTRRAFETAATIIEQLGDPGAEAVGKWLLNCSAQQVPPLPREVEIELTTQDQEPDTKLRPRGQRVPSRGPISLEAVGAIADSMARFDDALIVLGGFGDPLLHPQLDKILELLRSRGIFGAALRCNGIALDDQTIATLLSHKVDVLEISLDAWSDELYGELHPAGNLPKIRSQIEQLEQARSTAQQVAPLIVPHMTKCLQNVHEMDAFFDGWIRAVGWAVIQGYSNYAGQAEDLAVADMSPPNRMPCRRLSNRALILADGSMTLCDQDFTGKTAIGNVLETPLEDLWQSKQMREARAAHRSGSLGSLPMCDSCSEWHRP